MTDKLIEIKKIYTDYAQPNSDIDSGNLYWALGESLKIITVPKEKEILITNNLQDLTDLEKRRWLIQQMKEHWYLEDEDIDDAGNCKDDAIVEGNNNITLGDIVKICENVNWIGIEFSNAQILIDITCKREKLLNIKSCGIPKPDEFDISNGIISLWYD